MFNFIYTLSKYFFNVDVVVMAIFLVTTACCNDRWDYFILNLTDDMFICRLLGWIFYLIKQIVLLFDATVVSGKSR